MRFSDPLDDLFAAKSYVRVLRALDALPAEIDASIREIARRAGVSHPTASSILDALRLQGLVSVRRTLFADEYRFNQRHVLAGPLQAFFASERRASDEVVGVITQALREDATWVTEASLFGSFVRSEMRPDSDLDLALICPKAKSSRLRQIVDQLSEETGARFGNPVSPLIGAGSIQAMAQPGTSRFRLWRTVAKEGLRIIPTGERDGGG